MNTDSTRIQERIDDFFHDMSRLQSDGRTFFVSSTFQTHSVPLLHLVSQLSPSPDVVFVDTGFHYPETLAFRDSVVEDLGLRLRVVSSEESKLNQLGPGALPLYLSNPNSCCRINKISPLDRLAPEFDIWVSGVRRTQTSNRAQLKAVQPWLKGKERFHPILEWSDRDIQNYRDLFSLPAHPLGELGILSVGCMPCTSSASGHTGERDRRWHGQLKTECGLHLPRKNGSSDG